MLKREELTAERIEEIVSDARKAGYDFFLSAEEREASLKEAMTRYRPGDEAWVFEARPELREVVVDGVPQIDPAQTTLPDEWKALPAYALAPGATLTLTERRLRLRGSDQGRGRGVLGQPDRRAAPARDASGSRPCSR